MLETGLNGFAKQYSTLPRSSRSVETAPAGGRIGVARSAEFRESTVADVAREAGVSKAQAARALGAYGAVSDAVRSRVLAAAERLNYRPNQLARTLNTGRSQSIGVVLGDIENPYFSLATRGIADAVEPLGYHLVLANTSERVELERSAVELLLDKRVDGLIVAPASPTDIRHLREIVDARRPLVLLDRAVPELAVDVARVDVTAAARGAADHLLDLGHRRIGYITTANGHTPDPDGPDPLPSSVGARVAGLVEAFTARGSSWDHTLLRSGLHDEASIRSAVLELLEGDGASALIASDSLIGLAVLSALQDEGIGVPDQVSVVMYDDQPWARLVAPPITVVAQPTYDIGHAAGSRLAARISGVTRLPPLAAHSATLITRGSTGPAASAGAARSRSRAR
jgi:LacI family transcriptional regulator